MSDLFSAMMETPEAVMDETLDRVFTLTPDQIRQFQDHWVAKRFADLRPRVAMLDKLAREQGIDTVA
jgi:hypothetical protein